MHNWIRGDVFLGHPYKTLCISCADLRDRNIDALTFFDPTAPNFQSHIDAFRVVLESAGLLPVGSALVQIYRQYDRDAINLTYMHPSFSPVGEMQPYGYETVRLPKLVAAE